jgi:hypothetical protein
VLTATGSIMARKKQLCENWKIPKIKLPDLITEVVWLDLHFLSEKIVVTRYDVPKKKRFKDR